MKKYLIGIIILLAIGFFAWKSMAPAGDPNRGAAGLPDPKQFAAQGGTEFEEAEYTVAVKYKMSYDMTALAVSTKKYSGYSLPDRIAPKDVAFAWGAVAEYNDRIDFHFSQSGRWYYWRVDDASVLAPVGGESGVNRHSANNHLIPSTDAIKAEIMKIKTGDIVHVTGYLVDINAQKSDGTYYTWNSSTSRDDTGDGACEVIYVTGIEIK